MDENDRVATIGPTLSETLRPLAVRKPEPVLRRDSHVNEIARMDTGLSNSSGGPKSPAGNGSFSSASGGPNTLRSMFDAAKVVPGRSGGDSLEGSFAKPKTSPQRGNESRNSSFARAHGKATPEVDEAPRTYVLRKPEPVPRHDSLVNEIVQMDTGLSNNSNSQKQAVGNGSFSSASGGFNALRSMFDAAKVIPSRSGGGGDSLDGSFAKPKTSPQRGNEPGNSSFARAHGKSTPEGDAQTAQTKAATIQEPQLKRRGSTMSSSFERRRSSVTTSIAAGVTTFALAVSKIMDTMQNDSMNERRQAKVAELLDKEVMVLNAAQLAHIQKRRANPFTISINSSFRRWWDLVISLSVAYVIVATPIKVGFEVHSSGVIYGLDAVVDVIYLLDLCLNFFTSYEDDVTGEEIKDLVRIRKHYLTGWLAIDCLSSFPSSIIGVRNTFLTLTQVLKVTRVAKATDSGLSKAIYSRVNRSMNPSVMRMLELTMIFCVSQHFIACSYYFISLNQSMQTTWGPADEIRDSSLGQQYIDALYFAIMVTTANDVGPRTSIEKLYTSLMLFIGIVINASIIGSAANLLSNLDKEQIARKNQMDSINDYLRFKKVPLDLQNKIRRYYDYALNTRLRDPTESMFADLPDRLKLSLKLNLYSEFIHKVPLFKVCSHTGVIAIVQCLKFVVAMPGEIVICQGEFAYEFYLIKSGQVSLCVLSDLLEVIPLGNLGEGSFFGEASLLTGEAQRADVRAEVMSELAYLTKDDFMAIVDKFPTFHMAVKRISESRMQTAQNVQKMSKMNRKETQARIINTQRQPARKASFVNTLKRNRRLHSNGQTFSFRGSSSRIKKLPMFNALYLEKLSLAQAHQLTQIRQIKDMAFEGDHEDTTVWD